MMRVPEALVSKNLGRLSTLALAAGAALLLILLALLAYMLAGGSTPRVTAIVMLALSPFAAYFAVKRPLIFPFALFVALVPLNDILAFDQFGTVSKLVGMSSFLALAFWLVRKRVVVKPPLTILAWFALAVWMTVGGIWALNRADWLGDLTPGGAHGLLTFLELFCLYAVLAVIPVREIDWKAISLAIVCGGVIAAGFGVYDSFHASSFYGHRLWISNTLGDVVGPNHFAGALLLPVFITTAGALSERSWRSKIAFVLCLCILMAGIYSSGSRDAVLSVALGFLYLMWRTRYRAQLGLYILVAALVAVPHIADLTARFSQIAADSGGGRLLIWRIGWLALKNNWLLGAGLGNFPHAFDQAYLQVYERVPLGWGYAGHNLLLTSAVELGIFGAGLVLLAWLSQWFVLRDIDPTSPLYDSRIALETALIALFVSSMFVNDILYEKYAWLIFCVMTLLRSRYIVSLEEGNSYLPGIAAQRPAQSGLNRQTRHLGFGRDAGHKVPLP